MSDFNTVPAAVHRLELVGRERLVVSGVEDVDRFDETGIVMSTTAGTLVVTGEDLHIGKLSLDGGELHVDGRIDSVSYEDQGQSRGGPGLGPAHGLRPVHPAGAVRGSAVRPAAALPAPPPPAHRMAGRRLLPSRGGRLLPVSAAAGRRRAAGVPGAGGPGRRGTVFLRLFSIAAAGVGILGRYAGLFGVFVVFSPAVGEKFR